MIVLEGEPGIGKTRLLDEFESILDVDGWLAFSSRSSELDVDRPFSPISVALDELIERCAGEVPHEIDEASELLRQAENAESPLAPRPSM